MTQGFQLFGALHIAILMATFVIGIALGALARGSPRRAQAVRIALGVFLAVNELVWWVWRINDEGFRFPGALPLQLSDLTLWSAVAACLSLKQWCYELTWFLGLSATLLTLMTPDLWAPCWSYPTIYFFLNHAGVIVAALALTAGGLARPARISLFRALAIVNGWALMVGLFNLYFDTNYMYLCQKPASATILDLLGPWPWYIAASEGIAITAFSLLWLPFQFRRR